MWMFHNCLVGEKSGENASAFASQYRRISTNHRKSLRKTCAFLAVLG
jgi:hypothetical protein